MNIFPIDSAKLALKGSAKLTRESLREKLMSFEGGPDAVILTKDEMFPAWIVKTTPSVGTDIHPITVSVKDKLTEFWSTVNTLTGVKMPVAPKTVLNARKVLGRADVDIIPCTVAFPEDTFTVAVNRAAQILKKDFPLICDTETDINYVVFWRVKEDDMRISVKPPVVETA